MTNDELEKLKNIEQSLILFESKFDRKISAIMAEITGDFEEIKRQIRQLRQLNTQDEEQ